MVLVCYIPTRARQNCIHIINNRLIKNNLFNYNHANKIKIKIEAKFLLYFLKLFQMGDLYYLALIAT